MTDHPPSSDPDISLALEFIIGDYLAVVAENDPDNFEQIKMGVRKLATLAGHKVRDYDVDQLYQEVKR